MGFVHLHVLRIKEHPVHQGLIPRPEVYDVVLHDLVLIQLQLFAVPHDVGLGSEEKRYLIEPALGSDLLERGHRDVQYDYPGGGQSVPEIIQKEKYGTENEKYQVKRIEDVLEEYVRVGPANLRFRGVHFPSQYPVLDLGCAEAPEFHGRTMSHL